MKDGLEEMKKNIPGLKLIEAENVWKSMAGMRKSGLRATEMDCMSRLCTIEGSAQLPLERAF